MTRAISLAAMPGTRRFAARSASATTSCPSSRHIPRRATRGTSGGSGAWQFPAETADKSSTYAPVLAIPFAAPAGDPAAQKLAASVFTQVYGRLAIARHGQVALADRPLPAPDAPAALAEAVAHGSAYVIYGAVAGSARDQKLTVKIVRVADGSVSWSESYRLTNVDPADIAAEVSASVPHRQGD